MQMDSHNVQEARSNEKMQAIEKKYIEKYIQTGENTIVSLKGHICS